MPHMDPNRPLWLQDTLDSNAHPKGKLINCQPCRGWRSEALQADNGELGAAQSRRLPVRVRGPAAGPPTT